MSSENGDPKTFNLRPQDAQGGGFTIAINDAEQFNRMQEELAKLTVDERKKNAMLLQAAQNAGVEVVDF